MKSFSILILLISVLCRFGAHAQAADSVTILLKWNHQFEFAGYYAALEHHFFEEEGIVANIEINRSFNSQVKRMEEMDGVFGTANSNLLINRAKGFDVVLVLPIFQHSSVVFFTHREDEILHPQDLKGKRIVIPTILYPELSIMMSKEGIDPSTADIDTEWDLDKFLNGDADAILQLSIDLPYMRAPDSVRVLYPLQYGVDFYGECLFTTREQIERNPDRALRVKRAVIKGWEYALKNPGEIADLIVARYNPQLSREDLLSEAEEIRKLMLPDVVEIGHNNRGRWEKMYNDLRGRQEELGDVDLILDGFFLEDYVSRDSSELNTILTIVGIIAAVLATFLFITALVNRRLNRMLDLRLEEIRNRNEELVKMNNELDNFVYRVSHDLRAPISSSLGLLNLIKHESNGASSEYVELMRRSLAKLDNFILDILNYSRNSRLEITHEPVMIKELIDEVLGSLSFQNESVRTKVTVRDCDGFRTDRNRVYIILNNLLSNAFRYADLTKESPFIEVTADCIEGEVVLSVKDNGIGIDRAHQDRIFDMFYRAHDEGTGSGLGLYIVKEVVEKLHAKLEIESEVGAGTTIWVTIPGVPVSDSQE